MATETTPAFFTYTATIERTRTGYKVSCFANGHGLGGYSDLTRGVAERLARAIRAGRVYRATGMTPNVDRGSTFFRPGEHMGRERVGLGGHRFLSRDLSRMGF